MKLDWRHYIVYVTMMVVEGCALYVLLTLLNEQVADGRLSVLPLLLLLPLVFAFNRVLQRLRCPGVLAYTLNGLLWIIGMLIMVKIQLFSDLGLTDPAWLLSLPQAITNLLHAFAPQLLVLVASAVAWWLGWHLAHTRISFAASLSEFQFGLATMLVVFFVASQLEVHLDNAIPITLFFFIFALLGMSIAHAQEETGWLSGLRQGHWPGLLLVSIGLILVLGLAIGSVVTPGLLQLIIFAVKWVFGQIMRLIAFLMSLLPPPGPMEPMPGMNMTQGEPEGEGFQFEIPEPLLSGLRLGWEILFLGLLLFALWRISSQIFVWLHRRLSAMSGAEVEPISGAFRDDVLGFLKRILLKLLGFRLTIRRRRTLEIDESAPIRQIYRQLLQWAAASGWRRPAFQTPYEYLGTLEKLLPGCSDDFRFITQRYVSARYGRSPLSAQELLSLKQSWHQVSRYRLTPPGREADKSA